MVIPSLLGLHSMGQYRILQGPGQGLSSPPSGGRVARRASSERKRTVLRRRLLAKGCAGHAVVRVL